MNYLQRALTIVERHMPPDTSPRLVRLYTLLALTHGTATTRRHVHDAWSLWRTETDPTHPSLIPFGELTGQVQAYDQPYVDAIHAAARELAGEGSTP